MFVLRQNPLRIIDISNDNESTAKDLVEAMATQGFLFIEGHDFTAQEIDDLFQISSDFFKLPHEYKRKYAIDKTNHGYTDFGGEALDPTLGGNAAGGSNEAENGLSRKGDPKEALNMSALDFTTGRSAHPIPDYFTNDKHRDELIRQTIIKLYALTAKLLRLIARGLAIEDDVENNIKGEDWFNSKYVPDKPSGSTLRFLHYPPQKSLQSENTIRAGAHTDYGSITLLFQQAHQEGLEIYSPVSQTWEPVPYVPTSSKFTGMASPIVVNIGDLLNYWTAGYLKSTRHRVRFPPALRETGRDRYSVVFFCHPNDDALLQPVPSRLIRQLREQSGYDGENECITAAEHLNRRLAASHGWKS